MARITGLSRPIGRRGLCLLAALCAGCVGTDFLANGTPATERTFPDFANRDGLRLMGSATANGAVINLTPDQPSQAGAVFLETPVPLTATTELEVTFAFRIASTKMSPADGVAFVMHDHPKQLAAPLTQGGRIGHGELRPGVAIEFDIHEETAWDPNDNHIALVHDGKASTPLLVVADPGIDFVSPEPVWARVTYRAATLRLALGRGTPATEVLVAEMLDLPALVGPRAFIGITASTGMRSAPHELLSLSFRYRQ